MISASGCAAGRGRGLAERLQGQAQLHFRWLPRVAIFVSKQSHCLLDLLWRARSGELRCRFRW